MDADVIKAPKPGIGKRRKAPSARKRVAALGLAPQATLRMFTKGDEKDLETMRADWHDDALHEARAMSRRLRHANEIPTKHLGKVAPPQPGSLTCAELQAKAARVLKRRVARAVETGDPKIAAQVVARMLSRRAPGAEEARAAFIDRFRKAAA